MRPILVCLILLSMPLGNRALAASDNTVAGIDAFNRSFSAATRAMDNGASLALWENGGVSLLPDTPPIAGKPALSKFFAEATAQARNAHMISFDLRCHDIEAQGAWASEWCEEHQVVALGNGKAPFDGRGRMLLVLHRGSDGQWRLLREMWQPMQAAGR